MFWKVILYTSSSSEPNIVALHCRLRLWLVNLWQQSWRHLVCPFAMCLVLYFPLDGSAVLLFKHWSIFYHVMELHLKLILDNKNEKPTHTSLQSTFYLHLVTLVCSSPILKQIYKSVTLTVYLVHWLTVFSLLCLSMSVYVCHSGGLTLQRLAFIKKPKTYVHYDASHKMSVKNCCVSSSIFFNYNCKRRNLACWFV